MNAYSADVKQLKNRPVLRYRILNNDKRLRWFEVIARWQDNAEFRNFFITLLADAPFPAYFWETPPVTADSIEQEFEFILADSAQLAGILPDEHAFTNHFSSLQEDRTVVDFPNLGGDATLVVPCPGEPLSAYPHLATFSRSAPADQQHRFWAAVGAAVKRTIDRQPVWVSTSGLGVSWIHVRLDSYPKYYTHEPYRKLRYSEGHAS